MNEEILGAIVGACIVWVTQIVLWLFKRRNKNGNY